jgi:hypothetical protein
MDSCHTTVSFVSRWCLSHGLHIIGRRGINTRSDRRTDDLGIQSQPGSIFGWCVDFLCYNNIMRFSPEIVPYDIEVYFVHCSLSATTARVMIDMQNNSLRNSMPVSQPSTQWEIYQWTSSESNSWQYEVN